MFECSECSSHWAVSLCNDWSMKTSHLIDRLGRLKPIGVIYLADWHNCQFFLSPVPGAEDTGTKRLSIIRQSDRPKPKCVFWFPWQAPYSVQCQIDKPHKACMSAYMRMKITGHIPSYLPRTWDQSTEMNNAFSDGPVGPVCPTNQATEMTIFYTWDFVPSLSCHVTLNQKETEHTGDSQ